MIVPRYWAEAKEKTVVNGKQITVKRFGWSDISEAEASDHARARVKEAIGRAEKGQKVRKVDHKVSYNGAEGLPIREEVIERYNDSVLTRNSYGALCLNTPDVLFADIDFATEPGFRFHIAALLLLAALAAIAGWYFASWKTLLLMLFPGLLFTSTLAEGLFRLQRLFQGGPQRRAMTAIQAFARGHPDWHLRLYRTPMGFRVLVMHKTFRPNAEETARFFREVGADPLYVRMCKNQHCFRARVSPKPWRIGVGRMGPRPGVWPIKPERMPERRRWVARYRLAAANYSACRFVAKLGSDVTDPKADYVRDIHDRYCRAGQDLELA